MISGTYVLTDTIDRAFGDIFQEAARGIDVSVTPVQEIDSQSAQEVPLDGRLLERVQAAPGIEAAEGDVFSPVTVLDEDGDPLSTGGIPTFASSVGADRFEPFSAAEGRLPAGRRRDRHRPQHRRAQRLRAG
jgi:putative ABC transport system permease protein